MINNLDCPFCLSESAWGTRYDRHGRVYLACSICRHRSFVYSGMALFLQHAIATAVTQQREAFKAAAMASLEKYFGAEAAPRMMHQMPTRELMQPAGVTP